MDTSVVFVVDPPQLILESILLVGSVRKHLPGIDIQAYCPAAKRRLIPPQLTEFFERNGVTLNQVETEGIFSPDYPHGNKLLACRASRKTTRTLFLDTDVLVGRPFDVADLTREGFVSAAPEGRRTWGKAKFGQDWSYLYSLFDLSMPTEKVRLLRTNVESAPYFNAGVVGYVNKSRARDLPFGRCWLDTALTFDADKSINTPRPWLDQISLPVAAARQELAFNVLSQDWNMSLSRKTITASDELDRMNAADPLIIHYHNFRFFQGTRFLGLLDEIVRDFTIFEGFADLAKPYADFDKELKKVEDDMSEIRKIDKTARSRVDRLRLDKLKVVRHEILSRPQSQRLASWPRSIVS